MRLTLSWPLWNTVAFILVSLIGLGISSYLLVHYLGGTPVACGAGGGCDIVRLSEYSWMWGVIPRPLTGIAYYLGMIVLLILRLSIDTHDRWYLDELLFIGGLVGVLESAWLFMIQAKVIEAFCVWCLGSGIATVLLFLLILIPGPRLIKRP